MKLSDLEYMTDSKITYIDTVTDQVCASLERCEVKEGPILSGASAFGETKKEARKALAEKLTGTFLVKNAYGDRSEWKLPTVTVG
jgi:hypothetical protein